MNVKIDGLGKVTANKDTFNYLLGLAYASIDRHEQLGLHALASYDKKFADAIYEALDEVKYYGEN